MTKGAMARAGSERYIFEIALKVRQQGAKFQAYDFLMPLCITTDNHKVKNYIRTMNKISEDSEAI